jgi:hypothetical protein
MNSNRSRWPAVLLIAALASCGSPGDAPARPLRAGEVTERVNVYLIALEDGGVEGRRVGCGDSVVPVEVSLPRPAPALEAALEALLAKDDRFDPASGRYNALHASPLLLHEIEQEGGRVRIDLKGYLEIGGVCDAPRILAQLRETVLQFTDVQEVEITLGGQRLEDLLSGRGG